MDIDLENRKPEDYKHSLANDFPLIVVDLDKDDHFLGIEIHGITKIMNGHGNVKIVRSNKI